MEQYRRPRPTQIRARQAVDGFISVQKTNTPRPIENRAVNVVPAKKNLAHQIVAQMVEESKPDTKPAGHLPAIDMSLPEADESKHHAKAPRHSKWHAFRVWSLRAAVACLVLVIGIGGFLFSQGYLKLHKVFKGTAASAAALKADVDPNLLKGEGDGRINILLLGIGGAGHDGADLTDTIMLASVDPVNHTTSLLSIPRDLWVAGPNGGAMKINAAYETGKFKYLGKISSDNSNSQAIQAGFNTADQTIESVVGVPINYNVLVDFQAFKQAVDTVGGVTVNVPTQLYDPTMAWENNHNPILAQPGIQQMDGTHALIYVRSRETSSDFARSERQRSVMLALKDKVDTAGTLSNPAKISGLISAFGNNVHSDLSLGDASRLYGIIKGVGNNSIKSISLAGTTTTTSSAAGADSLVTTGNINGQSIVQPKAGLFDYDAIQNYVRQQLPDGYLLKEKAPITLLNGTSQTGLGASEATLLKSYGYNITTVGDAPGVYPQTIVVDLSHGKDKYTRHYLEQRFNTTAVTKLPDASIQSGNAKFVVLLGGDETSSSQN